MGFVEWVCVAVAIVAAGFAVKFLIDRKGRENPETVIDEAEADAKVQPRDGPGPRRPT